MEDRAFKLKVTAQLIGICEIAVVSKSHSAVDVIDNNRLCVVPCRATRSSVANVTDGDIALTELCHMLRCENIVDKSRILICGKKSVVIYNNAAGFLSSVLEGIKSVIHGLGNFIRFACINAENSAFFMYIRHK